MYLPSVVQDCCDCTTVDTFWGHLRVLCTFYMLAQALCVTLHAHVGLTEARPVTVGLLRSINPIFYLQTRWLATQNISTHAQPTG